MAERVVEILRQYEVESAVIGAAAMAVHFYPRYTDDFDLAINTELLPKLRWVKEALQKEGFEVQLDAPDPDDALGGVLRVTGDDFEPIEVVNFQNPWPSARDCTVLAREALREARIPLSPGSPLHVVSLPYLIALKLYAGGLKSKADVAELLERNRERLDMAELRDVCNRHELGPALESLLKEIRFA